MSGEPAIPPPTGAHLVLYDGVCRFCNRMNRFVLARDRRGLFHFASLQSSVGRSLVQQHGQDPDNLNTLYVVVNYRSDSPVLLSRARATLFLLETFGAPWRWAAVLGVLPDPVLNRGYGLVACARYRIFGRHESCPLPSAEYRDRFIDI